MLRMEHIPYREEICTRSECQLDFSTSKYSGHKCTANNYANTMAERCNGGVHFKTACLIYFMGLFFITIASNFDFKYIVVYTEFCD